MKVSSLVSGGLAVLLAAGPALGRGMTGSETAPATTNEAAQQAEVDAINRLIDKYAAAEAAGDMKAQGDLMTADRIWVNPRRGRRLDNVVNMQIQQAQANARRDAAPDLKLFVEDRERIIRLLGGGSVAVASFYRFYASIVPTDAPSEIKEAYGGTPHAPELISLVLEKRSGDWKIVFTHTSPTWQ